MLDKQENHADSTTPAPGYISPDQARELALKYAQEHRGFYGRFSEQELAWDALSVRRTGHEFEVRLSFRPVGNFRTAGGLATGVADGTATITATLSGIDGSATLEVFVPVVLESLTINPAKASIAAGRSQ
jgi:hypothetical protein